jgi:EF hand associated
MKIKNSWLILRHFGYDRKLDLVDDLFQDSLVIGNYASVELKERAFLFLRKIFNQYSVGGYLTLASVEQVFDTLEGKPY